MKFKESYLQVGISLSVRRRSDTCTVFGSDVFVQNGVTSGSFVEKKANLLYTPRKPSLVYMSKKKDRG